MVDVGLGQDVTTTGRARSKVLRDAVTDNHPVNSMMKAVGGKRYVDGGRTVVEEAKSGQNSTVSWVGESGAVSLTDQKVLDAAEFDWAYQLGSVTFTLAEQYKNSGGSDTKYIDLIAGKFEVLEDSMMNEFHAAELSNGTGDGGLQMDGLAALVSTTPTTGTVGGIDRSNANAAWFRNLAYDASATAPLNAVVSATNVKRFLDVGLDNTTRSGKSLIDAFLLGQTHWEYLTQSLQAIQQIQNESGTGRAGFEKMIYRGKPCFHGGGVNYSGQTAMTATRTYGLCLKPGGVNLVFHRKAEFEMLEKQQSSDQAAVSRLMFTMSTMCIGGLAGFNWVGFD